MVTIKNKIVAGRHNKPILTDMFYKNDGVLKPVVVFCHGYKGFKDWGGWNLMAETFANKGFFFVKFNFSHNGGTVEQPIDFPDLEAFGNNNYTKELDDLASVLDWLCNDRTLKKDADLNDVNLIGHSRAGGIVTIKAEEDSRIKSVVSLAGVCDYGKRTATIGNLEQWRKEGVKYVLNGRTKQQMPHYYQFYEDFAQNKERLSIKRAVSNLKVPYLIVHGDKDTSVKINEALSLKQWSANSQFEVIKGADHVFNTRHPWESTNLSPALDEVIKKIVIFLKR